MEEKINLEEYVISKDKLVEAHYCGICKSILLNPVSCANCESLFCQSCIKDFVFNNNSCFTKNCMFSENKLSKLAMKILDYINFCCMNYKDGCEATLSYSQFLAHIQNCDYRYVKCNFCETKLMNKELAQHILECDFAIIICEICSAKFNKTEYKYHKLQTCIKSILVKFTKENDEVHTKILDEDHKNKIRINTLEEENIILKEKIKEMKLNFNLIREDFKSFKIQSELKYLEYDKTLEDKFNELKIDLKE
jgi:hypothetical protein